MCCGVCVVWFSIMCRPVAWCGVLLFSVLSSKGLAPSFPFVLELLIFLVFVFLVLPCGEAEGDVDGDVDGNVDAALAVRWARYRLRGSTGRPYDSQMERPLPPTSTFPMAPTAQDSVVGAASTLRRAARWYALFSSDATAFQ